MKQLGNTFNHYFHCKTNLKANRGMQLQLTYGWFFPASCYIAAIIFAYRTIKELSIQSAELSYRTRQVQSQFARKLIAQVISIHSTLRKK